MEAHNVVNLPELKELIEQFKHCQLIEEKKAIEKIEKKLQLLTDMAKSDPTQEKELAAVYKDFLKYLKQLSKLTKAYGDLLISISKEGLHTHVAPCKKMLDKIDSLRNVIFRFIEIINKESHLDQKIILKNPSPIAFLRESRPIILAPAEGEGLGQPATGEGQIEGVYRPLSRSS